MSTFVAAASFAAIVGAAVPAIADEMRPEPRIIVTGEGSAEIAPDLAVVSLTVLREGKTAREALDASSEAMAAVLAAMKASGIEDRDLQTSNFSIQPVYVYPKSSAGADNRPEITGYTVRNSLTVRVRDISKVGDVLDSSVTLGVNEGGNILFTNDDPSAAIAEARAEAVKDAMARARTLAEAAGVGVGKILEMSENSSAPRPIPMMQAEMAMSRASDAVPVAAGENAYQVTVNVTFSIDQ